MRALAGGRASKAAPATATGTKTKTTKAAGTTTTTSPAGPKKAVQKRTSTTGGAHANGGARMTLTGTSTGATNRRTTDGGAHAVDGANKLDKVPIDKLPIDKVPPGTPSKPGNAPSTGTTAPAAPEVYPAAAEVQIDGSPHVAAFRVPRDKGLSSPEGATGASVRWCGASGSCRTA